MSSTCTRKMIGVLTAELNDAYQGAILRGIETRAKERGIGVVCFVGSHISSPVASEAAANVAYRLATPKNVDGLIIISAALSRYLDVAGIERVFSSRMEFPQVSVGVNVKNVSSITVDGSDAIRDIVEHLVEVHKRSRFALICGPREHAEVHARRRAFLSALEKAGIHFDEQLQASGSFLKESGAEAVTALLETGKPFDALFCMNDRMAICAIDALRAAGIRVPEDVSVVGFDGIDEGKSILRPLTTVVQPLEELGAESVNALCELLQGGVPRSTVLRCGTAILESCGCPPKRRFAVRLVDPPFDTTEAERQAIEELAKIVSSGDRSHFIERLNSALAETALSGSRLSRWNDFLSVVRYRANGSENEYEHEPAELFELARVLVGDAEVRMATARCVAAEERHAALRAISASLAGSFEIQVMLERLAAGLLRLGMGDGYIALFSGRSGVIDRSRLLLANQKICIHTAPKDQGEKFQTEQLLPEGIGDKWRNGLWILVPLIFQDEPLGYMMLPGGYEDLAVYESLRDQVSSALKGALLLEQVRTHERRLEAEVSRRTRELTRANVELKDEIERRANLEREVIEISNRTMERIGQDLHDDLCQHLAGIAMHVSVAHDLLGRTGNAAAAELDNIVQLLSDSIARVKQIARGLMPTGLEAGGLSAAIESMIENARRSYPVAIDFRSSPGFTLPDTDRALQVYRIVQEALSNAIKHSGSGRIGVSLSCQDTRIVGDSVNGVSNQNGPVLVAEVVDMGRGLPENLSGEGMGLRIMRYRAEKAGAELSVERLDPGTRVRCKISRLWSTQ